MTSTASLNYAPDKFQSKVAFFYREGDQRFKPVRIVINQKRYPTLASLMVDLNRRVPLVRGVRAIYSPRGRNPVDHIDEIVNEGRYVCSSSLARGQGVDPDNMQLETIPWHSTGPPTLSYAAEDSRFIRTGLPAFDVSDREDEYEPGRNTRSRMGRLQELRNLEVRRNQERMRTQKDPSWAERIRRIVIIRNGHPDTVKQYTLAMTTAYNLSKVKADLSEMFASPVDNVYTLDGKLMRSVEEMFECGDLAFVATFGEGFKAHQGYARVQNAQPLHKLPPIKRSHLKSPTVSTMARQKTKVLTPTRRRSDDFERPIVMTPPSASRYRKPLVQPRASSIDMGSTDELEREAENERRRGRGGVVLKPLRTELRSNKRPTPSQTSRQEKLLKKRSVARSEIVEAARRRVEQPDETSFSVMQSWPNLGRGDEYLLPTPKRKGEANLTEPSKPSNLHKRVTPVPVAEKQVRNRREVQHNTGDQIWAFKIVTGAVANASSSSNIIITAYGHRGSSEAVAFVARQKTFKAGTSETFKAKLPNIGDIYKIRVEISNSGSDPDWNCDEILMENEATGEQLHFPCRKWFSERMGDRQIVRELAAFSDSRPPVAVSQYDVIVKTGDLWNGSTSGTVTLVVFGERGDTGNRVLAKPINPNQKPFAKGQSDVFHLESVSLGEIRRIKLSHEPSSNGMGWFVESVTIRDRFMNVDYLFPANRWLSLMEDDRQLSMEVRATDTHSHMKIQDKQLWPYLKWMFSSPESEIVLYSSVSHKALRITGGGFIDSRGEQVDRAEGFSRFRSRRSEDAGQENIFALCSTSTKAPPSFIAFSSQKIVSKGHYSQGCDLRIHCYPTRELVFESEKYPSNYVSVASNGQLYPETHVIAAPGPSQSFYCYVKGCFRHEGIILLCTSLMQTLCIDRDPSMLTANGKRNRLAQWRVHKVSPGVRMFESVVFPNSFLQMKKGVCNCEGVGDKHCEFKVRRCREFGYITLECARERGYIGFMPNGYVQMFFDTISTSPQCRMYPEIVEFGQRKAGNIPKAAHSTDPMTAPRRDSFSEGEKHTGSDPDADLNSDVDDLYRDRYRKGGAKKKIVAPKKENPPKKPTTTTSTTTKTRKQGSDGERDKVETAKKKDEKPQTKPAPAPAPTPAEPSKKASEPVKKTTSDATPSVTIKAPPPKPLSPTIVPLAQFKAQIDCDMFVDAINSRKLSVLVDILTARTTSERGQIKTCYKATAGKDLNLAIGSVTSGNLFNLLSALLVANESQTEFAVDRLNKALTDSKKGLDDAVDIICTAPHDELQRLKELYQKAFNKPLEQDLKSSKPDDEANYPEKLLTMQLQRPKTAASFESKDVKADVAKVQDSVSDKTLTSQLAKTLSERGHRYLREFFKTFKDDCRKDISEVVKAEVTNGQNQKFLLNVIEAIRNKEEYLARRFQTVVVDQTDDADLIRLTVGRCEIDLADVKKEYEKLFKQKLEDSVDDQTEQGDYSQGLLNLLKGNSGKVQKQLEKQKTEIVKKEDPPPQKPAANEPKDPELKATLSRINAPTLVPASNFNAKTDCETLQKALKKGSVNEVTLMSILGKRSWSQRCEILKTYKTTFKKDLDQEISQADLSGQLFEDLLIKLLKSPADLAAADLKKAIEDEPKENDEALQRIVQIICCSTLAELQAVKEAYSKLDDDGQGASALKEDLSSEKVGFIGPTLASFLNRPASAFPPSLDQGQAKADAKKIQDEVVVAKKKDSEETFEMLLSTRGKTQLRACFDMYKHLYKKDVEEVIKTAYSGEVERGLLLVVEAVRSESAYCARLLKQTMDDEELCRLILARCEVDLAAARVEYEKTFKTTFEKDVKEKLEMENARKLVLELSGYDQGLVPKPKPTVILRKDPVYTPTIKPIADFDAAEDCEALNDAINREDADEGGVVVVLAKRSWDQRAEIEKVYNETYEEELEAALSEEGKVEENFRHLMMTLLKLPMELSAVELERSFEEDDGEANDKPELFDNLMELVCGETAENLKLLKDQYKTLYKTEIEKRINEKVPAGILRKFFVGTLNRPSFAKEKDADILPKAKKDAEALHKAAKDPKTKPEAFDNLLIDLFTKRSPVHLRAIFDYYAVDYSEDSPGGVEALIKEKYADKDEQACRILLDYGWLTSNKPAYFAKRMHQAIETENHTWLSRVLVSRSELDLANVKVEYQRAFGKALAKDIETKTQGDFRMALTALVTGNYF